MRWTLGLIVIALLVSLSSCCGALPIGAAPTATPYPTYTPPPTCTPPSTYTPHPTLTPRPPATPTPLARVGQWVSGHFWQIRVNSVRTATVLDGERPTNGTFVVAEVVLKANGTAEMHHASGVDFALVDDKGKEYVITGMILEPDGMPAGTPPRYQRDTFLHTQAQGTYQETYQLVYDLPASIRNLHLWFADLPEIDLGL